MPSTWIVIMIKKIFRNFNLIFSILIISSSLFTAISPIQASPISSIDNENKSLDISNEGTTRKIDISKNTDFPDLGDDQTFPFIPGFGKNSGKD